MAIVLGLLAAVSYGAADFCAGVGSRRLAVGPVVILVQATALLTAVVGVVLLPGVGASAHVLTWGALAGAGSAVGTVALYRGFAAGAMSPVATSSAVLAAVLPAVVGVATGDHLSTLVAVGILLALPAIALVSWSGGGTGGVAGGSRLGTGLLYGSVAGAGFGWLFVAYDRAGSHAGAWPVLASTSVGLLLVLPFARGAGRPHRSWRGPVLLAVAAGLLSGSSNLLFVRATGIGQLAVIAVLTSLYPAATVLLARVVLHERWTRVQAVGLVVAAGAVVLVSVG